MVVVGVLDVGDGRNSSTRGLIFVRMTSYSGMRMQLAAVSAFFMLSRTLRLMKALH